MADPMCGPSNALQNFQKHSTVDRTLQQDRLIGKPTSAQGFRSTGPNARQFDPEFEAFQAGQLPLDQGFQHQGPGFSQYSQHPPQNFQPGPAGNWASDFQRLNISGPQQPPPHFQQQGFGLLGQQRNDTGGWHQDFARQQGQMAGPSTRVNQVPQQPGVYNRFSKMSGELGMGTGQQYSSGFAGQQEQNSVAQQNQHQAEQFDEEAFARAFDEAARSEMETMEETESKQQDIELGQDIMISESAERLMSSIPSGEIAQLAEQARIGADQIHDPNSPQDPQEQQDPNALARTAGHLLSSVRNESSEKFKGSQFLELMRQFRDREAIVEGNDVVGQTGDTRMNTENGNGGSEESIKVAEP